MIECPLNMYERDIVPWHEQNINCHLAWCPVSRESTLTLYTKDHKKLVKVTDAALAVLDWSARVNFIYNCRKEWQKELMALYENMGD